MDDESKEIKQTDEKPKTGITVGEFFQQIRDAQSAMDNAEPSQDTGKKGYKMQLPHIDGLVDLESLKAAVMPALEASIETYRAAMQKIHDYFVEHADEIQESIRESEQQQKELQPFLDEELAKPEYGGRTIDEMLMDGNFDDLLQQAFENASAAMTVSKSIEQLHGAGIPKHFYIPNTPLSNALEALDGKDPLIDGGNQLLPVLSVGKPNEVGIIVNISAENIALPAEKNYTEYDRHVSDAINTMYEDRTQRGLPPIATADMIYRIMTHRTNDEYVSPQQRAAVTKSIEKQRRIMATVNATEEMKRRNVVTNPNGKTEEERHAAMLEDYLLSATKIDNLANGKNRVTGYLFREPLLLSYGKLTKQIITIKGDLLSIKETNGGQITEITIADNETRLAIKSYLLRRVEIMKHDESNAADSLRKYNAKRKKDTSLQEKTISNFRKLQRVILFDSIFAAANITAPNTKTRSRDYVQQVLDYWKAKKEIKGYKTRKKGKTIDAIIIEF